MKNKELNPIKPTFSIEVFKSKKWLPPHEYYLHIAQESIKCGLISDSEFKMFSSQFRRLKLSPVSTCLAFDTIIKTRWEERDNANYFNAINREASERDSFANRLLRTKIKKK